MKRALALAVILVSSTLMHSQQPAPPAPPMGWNSWDSYGLTITEDQFRANVAVLRDKLLPSGYRYAVIDEGWFFENPEDRPHPEKLRYALDPNGRYVPVPARFPSAGAPGKPSPATAPLKFTATLGETSFAALGQWVHAQGLLFGIHIVRGIPRASVERNLPIAASTFHAQDAADTTDACPWDPTNWGIKDTPAGQAWYDSLLQQYAAWGVDLLKVDCISDHPYKADEIRMIRRAIDKVTARTHRPIVLSLSPGPTNPDHAGEVAELSNMWRISDDVWDVWSSSKPWPQTLRGLFDRAVPWSQFDLPAGHYPDFDMLPLGHLGPVPGEGPPRQTRLTPDEQRSLLTLWAINRSPLIIGANLTQLDPFTLSLLTNPDLLAIDQHGQRGTQIEPVPADEADEDTPTPIPNLRIWTTQIQTGKHTTRYAALFNLGDTPLHVTRSITELSLIPDTHNDNPESPVPLQDVWQNQPLDSENHLHLTIPPHGVILLKHP